MKNQSVTVEKLDTGFLVTVQTGPEQSHQHAVESLWQAWNIMETELKNKETAES